MALSPEIAVIIAPVAGALAGWLSAWFTIARKARLERGNQAALAAANYSYASNLQELTRYIARKHRVVAELHVRLMDAKSKILRLGRNVLRPQLDRANVDDVRRYMQEQQVLGGVQEEVLAMWPTDREAAIEKLNEWLTVFDGERAQRALIRARNYALDHQLYISEPTVSSILDMLRLLELQLWQTKPPRGLLFGVPPAPDRDEIDKFDKAIIAQLRGEIRPKDGLSTGGEKPKSLAALLGTPPPSPKD